MLSGVPELLGIVEPVQVTRLVDGLYLYAGLGMALIYVHDAPLYSPPSLNSTSSVRTPNALLGWTNAIRVPPAPMRGS